MTDLNDPPRTVVDINLDDFTDDDMAPMVAVRSGEYTTVITVQPVNDRPPHLDVATLANGDGKHVESSVFIHKAEEF